MLASKRCDVQMSAMSKKVDDDGGDRQQATELVTVRVTPAQKRRLAAEAKTHQWGIGHYARVIFERYWKSQDIIDEAGK